MTMLQIIGLLVAVAGIGRIGQELCRTIAAWCKSPAAQEAWTSLSVLVAGIASILIVILSLMLLGSSVTK